MEVDLRYPYNIRQQPKHFPFVLENKIRNKDNFEEYMKKIKPKKHVSKTKLICDWTDKMKFLIHYRLLNIHIRHGMDIEKVHEIISFKQSKWLEK